MIVLATYDYYLTEKSVSNRQTLVIGELSPDVDWIAIDEYIRYRRPIQSLNRAEFLHLMLDKYINCYTGRYKVSLAEIESFLNKHSNRVLCLELC